MALKHKVQSLIEAGWLTFQEDDRILYVKIYIFKDYVYLISYIKNYVNNVIIIESNLRQDILLLLEILK